MSVKLYIDANFSGQSKEFFGSLNPNQPIFYPISSLHPIGNDSVSSLKIGPFTKVTLYSDQNPERGSKYVSENNTLNTMEIPYIGNDWNDIVSALTVESLPAGTNLGNNYAASNTEPNLMGVKIFEKEDYRNDGKSFILKTGNHILPPHAIKIGRYMGLSKDKLNNDVSSIQVGKGYYAVIFDREDFTGNNMIYITQNIPKLSSIDWEDKASSISVYTIL